MKTFLFIVLLFLDVVAKATTYTDFYVDANASAGTNVNSGSTSNALATYTSTNGNWDGASLFVPTDGSTPAGTVTTNTFASVYLDGATNAVYIARIETVAAGVNGTITLSTTAVGGTAPTSGATGRSIKVGGAWSGPRNSSTVPFGVLKTTCTNASGNSVRCNWRSGSSNVLSVGITDSSVGPMHHEGYLTNPGDGLGRAIIDANNVNMSLLTLSGVNVSIANFIFQHNLPTGTGSGLISSGGEQRVTGCVANGLGGRGFSIVTSGAILTECEAYNCNQGTNADFAGFYTSATGTTFDRCYSHDNLTAASSGFTVSASTANAYFIECIAQNNGSNGFSLQGQALNFVKNCNSVSNGLSGIDLGSGSACVAYIENCALFNNLSYGINSSGSLLLRDGLVKNCVYGSGNQTNVLGNVVANLNGIEVDTPIIYTASSTPWTSPTTGNFTPVAGASIVNTGRGTFTATKSGYTPTLSYPDIGAGQITNSATAGGGGGPTSFGFSQ